MGAEFSEGSGSGGFGCPGHPVQSPGGALDTMRQEITMTDEPTSGVEAVLRAALEPFAREGELMDHAPDDYSFGRAGLALTAADFRRARAALATPAASPATETGWLIELKGTTPSWAIVNPNDYDEHWTTDSTRALRFARRADAESYIAHIGWTEAFASEHIWDDGRRSVYSDSSAEDYLDKRLQEARDRSPDYEKLWAEEAERAEAVQEEIETLKALICRIEPHVDAIVCYASTMGEHEPNRIAHEVRAVCHGPSQDELVGRQIAAQMIAKIDAASPSPAPAAVEKIKVSDEQTAYGIGYDNPAMTPKAISWVHLTVVNAHRCGQMDRQNQRPRNRSYRREDYDGETFERVTEAAIEPAPAAVEELVARLVKLSHYNGAGALASMQDALREAATALATLAADKARIEAGCELIAKHNAQIEREHEKTAEELNRWIKMHAAVVAERDTLRRSHASAEQALLDVVAERDAALREKAAALGLIQGHAAIIEAAEARASALEGEVEKMRPHVAKIVGSVRINDSMGRVVAGQTEAATELGKLFAALSPEDRENHRTPQS